MRIAGFKSIRDQTIELSALNLLIGANGAGKSNFIGVFRLLNDIVASRLQLAVPLAGGADRILYFGRKKTDKLILDLEFGWNGYFCELAPSPTDSLLFANEVIRFHGEGYNNPWTQSLETGHKETALWDELKRKGAQSVAKHVIDAFQTWRIYHFHDTSATSKVKQTGDLNDNRFLRQDAGNLAAFLYRLQETQPATFRNIVEAVRLVAPFFGSFNLQPDRLNPDTIRLEWQEAGSDGYFDASSISDGTLRFMSLATLLLQPELPSTVLLDEPELGLHPYAITVLAELLQSAAQRTQVVLSTQSVTLVNQFSPEDVLVVSRVDGASEFKRLSSADLADWIDDYALGELWEKNLLGGRPSR